MVHEDEIESLNQIGDAHFISYFSVDLMILKEYCFVLYLLSYCFGL